MRSKATNETRLEPPRQIPAPQPESKLEQPCTLCSGYLVMDSDGTALFCDECWNMKWSQVLGSD